MPSAARALGYTGFNEAAGIHRRKPATASRSATSASPCFNEAAGIHRRKLRIDFSRGVE